jgi:hypothetical protein
MARSKGGHGSNVTYTHMLSDMCILTSHGVVDALQGPLLLLLLFLLLLLSP